MTQDIFVGREDEQEQYKDFLTGEEAWMLLITGLGGIGKSSLLRRLAKQTPADTCVVTVNFAEEIHLRTDPLKLLGALALLLQAYTDTQQYNTFLESIRADYSRFEHYQTQIQQSAQSRTLVQTRGASGTSTMNLPDEVSAFLQQVHQATQEIQRQMWALATNAFFTQLDTLKRSRSVFMFDTCELLNEPESWEVSQWLMSDFLPRLHLHTQQTGQPCFVVMASRVPPQSEVIDEQEQRHIVLSMLDRQAADEYLELVGIDDPILRQRIYQITHGHALCISIIGAFYQEPGQLPISTTDLSLLQQEFDEQLSIGFINDRILNNLVSPFKELTQYGVLLRSFTLPLLKVVFPELLPEPTARDSFEQFIRYPYIESLGNYRYSFHELVREILAKKTQKEHPEEWKRYHKHALDYFTQDQISSQPSTRPIEWYYHALSYSIACGKEEEGMAYWREAVQEAHTSRTRKDVGVLLQIAYDHTLKLSPVACALREYEQGRSYYYIQQWEAALKSYEQALWFFEQAQDPLGQAPVAKAMGDVQRAQTKLDTAQQSYQEALSLYKALGNRSGQAKVLQALGSIKQARHELGEALDSYEQAFRLFGQEEDRLGQADVCKAIGDVQRAFDKREEALQRYSQAIALYENVGSDRGKLEAEQARDELYALVEIKRTKDQAHFVYVSASRADSVIAERLKADLQTRGIAVWTEQERIQPGTFDWEEALRSTIREAAAVVLIASPNAHSSRSVKETLRIAEMYRRPVYPVWVTGLQWADVAPQGLSEKQYIDAREANYLRALNEIAIVLSQAPLATLKPQAEFVETLGPLSKGVEPRNPYKGLRSFTSSDANDYFGRDRLVDELITTLQGRLAADEERLLAVIGPSGSGKSSVIMAGLLPRLQAGALPGSEQWVYLVPMVPGQHPLDSLVLTLAPFLPDRSLKSIREGLEGDSADGLHLLATRLTRNSGAKVVLYIDQFEELFTQTAREDERQHFIDLLVTALQEPHGPVVVFLTLRADFYDRPMRYPLLHQLIQTHQTSVLLMALPKLREVIEKPAALPDVLITFEGDLVGDLLFEVQGQVGALPLLQFTLDQLFQRRSGRLLTLSAYRELGGVKGALAKHAEDTYTLLPSDEHRRLVRALFLRLIDPGITEQDTTRRRAALSEFTLDDDYQTRLLRETIDAFVTARLLTTNEVAGTTTIEVSHEALIREWARLAAWLREAREDISIQQILSKDVTEWERRGKPRDRLYRGTLLTEAQAWAERNMPSIDEVAFLQAGVAEREREQAERAREEAEDALQERELGLQRLAARRLRYLSSVTAVAAVTLAVGLILSLFLYAQLQVSLPASVTNLNDHGPGSLREAIKNASPGSTISFAKGLKGMITLTSGELVINTYLIIAGPGASLLSISGNHMSRVFNISNSVTEALISGLTIKNGNTADSRGGGCILNNSILSLTDSTISGCVSIAGGGINNNGVLTVTYSTISGNIAKLDNAGNGGYGGGIFNYDGTLNIIRSTISHNTSSSAGGGIDDGYTLSLETSTIANNSTSGWGGGINVGGGGQASIFNSTIYGNVATEEGGNIHNTSPTAPIKLHASIVAGGNAPSGNDISGTVISFSVGYNLIGTREGATIQDDGRTIPSNLFGSPKVGPLQENGGPTQTIALLPGSPGIDSIPLAACPATTDQRGVKRPDENESTCDIGAYEFVD